MCLGAVFSLHVDSTAKLESPRSTFITWESGVLKSPITVGDGATIGANACVTKDVEAGATVIDTGIMNNRILAPRKKRIT